MFHPGYAKRTRTPCTLLLMCHRSAVYKTKGVAICGGDYHTSSTAERVNHEYAAFYANALSVELFSMSPIWPIIDRATAELVGPLSSLDISDAEYVILKLLCLCVEGARERTRLKLVSFFSSENESPRSSHCREYDQQIPQLTLKCRSAIRGKGGF